MNIKLITLTAAGLLLAACGPKTTEPPKADTGMVTQLALPHDATGNWGIKFFGSQPNKPDNVLDFMNNPMGIPLPAT